MADLYYVQKATAANDVIFFYGSKSKSKHNHKAETAFSKKAKDIMTTKYPNDDVDLRDIVQQAQIPTGGDEQIELKWKNKKWTEA
jgi:hypothetical protein